jgi:hypothetical protein
MRPDVPHPSSRTVEWEVIIEVVRRKLVGEESHSAMRGVIFQRTGWWHRISSAHVESCCSCHEARQID